MLENFITEEENIIGNRNIVLQKDAGNTVSKDKDLSKMESNDTCIKLRDNRNF